MTERRNSRNAGGRPPRQNPYNQGPNGQGQYGRGPYQQQGGPYQQGPGGYYEEDPRRNNRNRKKKKKKVIFIIEIVVLLVLALGLFGVAQMNKMQRKDIAKGDIIINDNIDDSVSGFTNIALFGLDSREGQLDINAHSDALMIASINNKTKEVKLVSVYRDTYLDNTNGEYRKATEAYFFGGPERAVNMLNKNLDLNISDYVTVDFNVMADVIDELEGIEIDVEQEEIQWINGYQEEGSQITDRDIVLVEGPGLQTLNGLQALSYCRIRYTAGSDYKRTERQRAVLEQMMQKAKTAGVTDLVSIYNKVAGNMLTSLSNTDLLSLLKDIAAYEMGETTGFPFESQPQNTASAGDCVIPVNLANNVSELHRRLFGTEDYSPSEAVQSISNEIINATGIQ